MAHEGDLGKAPVPEADEAYTADKETNLNNACYERPAMPALAGEVAGRRTLDAVSGFDASAGTLEPARRRLGDGADPVATARRCSRFSPREPWGGSAERSPRSRETHVLLVFDLRPAG